MPRRIVELEQLDACTQGMDADLDIHRGGARGDHEGSRALFRRAATRLPKLYNKLHAAPCPGLKSAKEVIPCKSMSSFARTETCVPFNKSVCGDAASCTARRDSQFV